MVFSVKKNKKYLKYFFKSFLLGSVIEHPYWGHADPSWSHLKKN